MSNNSLNSNAAFNKSINKSVFVLALITFLYYAFIYAWQSGGSFDVPSLSYLTSLGITVTMIIVGILITNKFIKLQKTDEIPNTWTSLGVLFTFISFLLVFQLNKDWSDVEGVVTQLSSAFVTSIIGISMSKYMNYLLRQVERNKENEQGFENPEMVLSDMRDIIKDLNATMGVSVVKNDQILSNISSTFKSFSESIGASISTNIDQVMQDTMEKMNDTIQELGKTIGGNIDHQIESQTEKTNELNQQYISLLEQQKTANMAALDQQKQWNDKVFKEQVKQSEELLVKQVDSNQKMLVEQQASMKQFVQSFNKDLDGVIKAFENSFKDNVDEITMAFERLEKWSHASEGKFETLTSKFERLVNYQNKNEDLVSEAISKQGEGLQEISKILEKIIVNVQYLERTSSIAEVESINSKLEDIINHLKDAA